MKTTTLFSVILIFLFSCKEKEEPAPELPAPKLEGKWELLGADDYRNNAQFNGVTTYVAYNYWSDKIELEFDADSDTLKHFANGVLQETATYKLTGKKLKLTLFYLSGLDHFPTVHIDSLTHNRLVFRDTVYSNTGDGFQLLIYRARR